MIQMILSVCGFIPNGDGLELAPKPGTPVYTVVANAFRRFQGRITHDEITASVIWRNLPKTRWGTVRVSYWGLEPDAYSGEEHWVPVASIPIKLNAPRGSRKRYFQYRVETAQDPEKYRVDLIVGGKVIASDTTEVLTIEEE